MPKIIKILPKWRNLAESAHTGGRLADTVLYLFAPLLV